MSPPALTTLAALAALSAIGCGPDPIVARADQERASQGGSGDEVRPPPGAEPQPGRPGEPQPGAPGLPQPGDPGQPSPGDAAQPPPGAPDQPSPGVPEEPEPGLPGGPGAEAAVPGQPVDGPTVVLRGEVRYADYRAGKVRVDVFDGDQLDRSKRPGVVGWADLSAPGSFELTVPASTGKVWLSAFNDANSDGKPGHTDPTGFFADNPVTLEGDAVDGLIIELEYNPPPERE
jgi:hypothetical protein